MPSGIPSQYVWTELSLKQEKKMPLIILVYVLRHVAYFSDVLEVRTPAVNPAVGPPKILMKA